MIFQFSGISLFVCHLPCCPLLSSNLAQTSFRHSPLPIPVSCGPESRADPILPYRIAPAYGHCRNRGVHNQARIRSRRFSFGNDVWDLWRECNIEEYCAFNMWSANKEIDWGISRMGHKKSALKASWKRLCLVIFFQISMASHALTIWQSCD